MHYKILIEGGFTGIPREYKGETTLGVRDWKKLVEALDKNVQNNPQLRDGQRYHVELEDERGIFRGDFDESNLPSQIRNFIDSMIN